MREALINLLKTYGYPVRRQGSIGPKEKYPDSFFTIWNGETDDVSHYDDKPTAMVWDFDVNFYSKSPSLVDSTIVDVVGKLRKAGWIVSGYGYDLPTDEPTHVGRGILAVYREITN